MILFAALTAEEQGLLGSEYLAKHSPVMLPRISLDMNFDALVPIGDPEEVEVWGAKRTTFYSSVEGTARTFGLTIRSPGSGVLYGSERCNLARAGIPSFSIPEGLRFKGHDEAWVRRRSKTTWSTAIIKTTDQLLSGAEFTGGAELPMFGYELGAQAASQIDLVGWLPGEEFDLVRRESRASERKALPHKGIKPRKP